MAGSSAFFQATPPRAAADAVGGPGMVDGLQRSVHLDHYTLTAESGAGRGEDIYFYKCWMCHNKYAKTGPNLHELYPRATFLSGDAVDDQAVAAKIKEGGPGMPAFGTTLNASEISDLVTYIKSGKCCVREKIPRQIPGIARNRTSGRFRAGFRAA